MIEDKAVIKNLIRLRQYYEPIYLRFRNKLKYEILMTCLFDDEQATKHIEFGPNLTCDIKEIGDENRDQIIDDVDIIEENNICNENEKSKNEEENEKNDENLNEYINIEENGKQINNNENKNELNQESDNIINNEEKENIINNDEKNDKELDNEIDKKYIEEETKQKIENNE